MFRRLSLAVGVLLRPAGVVVIPLLMWAANGEWPSALLMAFLMAVSSRPVVVGQLGVVLFWMGLHAHERLAVALVGGSGPALFSVLQAAVFLAVLLARCAVTRMEEQNAPNWAARVAPWFSAGLAVASAAFFLASLFRSFPRSYTGWACVAALYAWRMRDRSVPGKTRLVQSLGTFLLVLLSTGLGVVLMEAGARLLLPDPPKPSDYYETDPEVIFTLSPESSGTLTLRGNDGKDIAAEVRISRQGIRDREYGPKAPGEYRILLLGDSFTMGHGLAEEETISRRLERLLAMGDRSAPVTVINCGVGGYAPWQERMFLRKRGFPLEPDLVILQLFPGNDVAGSYSRAGKRLEAFDEEWEVRLRDYKRQREIPFRLELWLLTHSNAYGHFLAALKLNAPARDILADFRFVKPAAYPTIVATSGRSPYKEVCLEHWYPELEEAWEMFAGDVRGIRDDCRARSVKIAAYAHGDRTSLRPWIWDEMKKWIPETPYEMNKDIRLTNELLDSLGIPRADALSALSAVSSPRDAYFMHDGHFTPLGAEMVAECLAQFIQERFLP